MPVFDARSASGGEGAVRPGYGSVIGYRICCSADLLALTSRKFPSPDVPAPIQQKGQRYSLARLVLFMPGRKDKGKRGTA